MNKWYHVASGHSVTGKRIVVYRDDDGTIWIVYTFTGYQRRFNNGDYSDASVISIRNMLTHAGYQLEV